MCNAFKCNRNSLSDRIPALSNSRIPKSPGSHHQSQLDRCDYRHLTSRRTPYGVLASCPSALRRPISTTHAMITYTRFCLASLSLTAGLLFPGCAGNGYITSSVSTVLGLDVSENPKTQVPHVRFGYVRSGLYYVPTGKTESANGGSTTSSGQANETPSVVSDIFVHSKFLTDITISEKFAIGSDAVQSQAAQQSFRNQGAQAVAGGGTPTVVEPPPPTTIVQQVLPPRTEERRESAAQLEQSHREAKESSTRDKFLLPAGKAVKDLSDAAKSNSLTPDWGALLKAAGGQPTSNKKRPRRTLIPFSPPTYPTRAMRMQ